MKYSTTHKAQVIEEGDYLQSTQHIVQYDGVSVETIMSPASGHWLIAVPEDADEIDIRAGSIKVPFYPENKETKLSKCQRHYQTIGNTLSFRSMEGQATSSNSLFFQYDYTTIIRKKEVILVGNSAKAEDGVNSGVNGSINIRDSYSNNRTLTLKLDTGSGLTTYRTYWITALEHLAADATLSISDASTETVVG